MKTYGSCDRFKNLDNKYLMAVHELTCAPIYHNKVQLLLWAPIS